MALVSSDEYSDWLLLVRILFYCSLIAHFREFYTASNDSLFYMYISFADINMIYFECAL